MRRFAAIVTSVLLAAGCYMPSPKTGKTRTLSKQVELGEAEKVVLDINMGVGELQLAGGSESLLDARFEYNIPTWRPEVEYEVEEGTGNLDVSQPPSEVAGAVLNEVRNAWDLKVSDEVPLYLDLDVGVGKSVLNLSNVNLTGYDRFT